MADLRIVSLLPSATEIVCALGLREYLVGRSHECDFPPALERLPVCTRSAFDTSGSSGDINQRVKEKLSSGASIFQIDLQILRELKPTHVLSQTLCEVCAVSFADVERAFQEDSGLMADLIPQNGSSISGVWADVERVAAACDCGVSGERLIASLKARLSEIESRAQQTMLRPRVAAIEWLEPLMAAGNWIPELIGKAGGQNLFGVAGQHSPWMKPEELTAADPEVIVALPCGFDLARTRVEMRNLTALAGWQGLKAVRSGKVFLCDGNQFMNRPGPRLVESLQIFAEILHPELFPPTLEGIGWERF